MPMWFDPNGTGKLKPGLRQGVTVAIRFDSTAARFDSSLLTFDNAPVSLGSSGRFDSATTSFDGSILTFDKVS